MLQVRRHHLRCCGVRARARIVPQAAFGGLAIIYLATSQRRAIRRPVLRCGHGPLVASCSAWLCFWQAHSDAPAAAEAADHLEKLMKRLEIATLRAVSAKKQLAEHRAEAAAAERRAKDAVLQIKL